MDDGTRTHDGRDHNPGLYQLSYVHHPALRSRPDRMSADFRDPRDGARSLLPTTPKIDIRSAARPPLSAVIGV